MACWDFERGTPNRIAAAATSYASITAACSLAVLYNAESIPGAASYHNTLTLYSATTARLAYMELNGDSGVFTCMTGAGIGTGLTNAIVPVTGEWEMLVCTFPGTATNATMYHYKFATGAWNVGTTTSVMGARTAGSVTVNVGTWDTADYFDGKIQAVMACSGEIPAGLVEGMTTRAGWLRALMASGAARNGVNGLLMGPDFTPNNIDWLNPGVVNFTAGTAPPVDGDGAPGW